MIDRLEFCKAIILADRGYESYNNIAHIQEKGLNFLFRIKDANGGIKQGLILPPDDIFDIDISLKLTNKNTKKVNELCKDKNHYKRIDKKYKFDFLPSPGVQSEAVFYEINFRIVRFPISENLYETVLTNLNRDEYPIEKLKELYAKRWGIIPISVLYPLCRYFFNTDISRYLLQQGCAVTANIGINYLSPANFLSTSSLSAYLNAISSLNTDSSFSPSFLCAWRFISSVARAYI